MCKASNDIQNAFFYRKSRMHLIEKMEFFVLEWISYKTDPLFNKNEVIFLIPVDFRTSACFPWAWLAPPRSLNVSAWNGKPQLIREKCEYGNEIIPLLAWTFQIELFQCPR